MEGTAGKEVEVRGVIIAAKPQNPTREERLPERKKMGVVSP